MGELSFREIEHGSGSGSRIKDQGSVVIGDLSAWEEVWNKIQGKFEIFDGASLLVVAEPPPVDFDNETVVVILRGQCSTGGYGIQVVRVLEEDDRVIVQVTKTGHRGMAAMVITYPYQIIAIAIPSGIKPVVVELIK